MRRSVLAALAALCVLASAEDGARYLVITADAYFNSIQPLAAWKQACGMKCEVVKLSQIGSDTTAIKTYVRNAYNTWPIRPEYVLIVGSPNAVPARLYTDQHGRFYCSSDNIYADMTGDLRAEIPVGRLPATSTTQLDAMVAKTLVYERTPEVTDSLWMRRLTTIVREGGDSDDTLYWNNIRRAAGQAGAAGFVSCDSLSYYRGQTSTDVIASANRGTGMILYRGAATGSWYTPFLVSPSQVTVNNKLPIILSITCETMTLVPYEQMLGDSWMRTGSPANPRGAVAFFGNTHSSSNVARVRGAVCRGFFDGLFTENQHKLGKACLRAKQQLYQEFPTYTSDYRGFNLLGDPDMSIWTATPHQPQVDHPAGIHPEPQQLVVTVSNGLAPIEGALVCASMDTTVYAYGYTNAQGSISLSINPPDTGNVRLVVTGRNLYPYDVSILVTSTGISDSRPLMPGTQTHLTAMPSVFSSTSRIKWNAAGAGARLTVYDAAGNTVRSFAAGSTGRAGLLWDGRTDGGRQTGSGVYLCVLTDRSGQSIAHTSVTKVR